MDDRAAIAIDSIINQRGGERWDRDGGAASAHPGASAPAPDADANGESRDLRAFMSPVVARMVAEHGLDIAQIPGSGRGGRVTKRDVEGFHARVVQHEYDHLIGVLYPMRIRDFSRFGYTDVLFPDGDVADD